MTNILQCELVKQRPRGAAAVADKEVRSAVGQEVLLDVVAVGLEQHTGAAQLTDLLVRPLDHAVALAALGMQYFTGRRDFEALLGARLGLQLGHLALLMVAAIPTRPCGERRPAKLLVRALKVRGFSTRGSALARMTATAALNQPGDRRRPYGRARRKWQR